MEDLARVYTLLVTSDMVAFSLRPNEMALVEEIREFDNKVWEKFPKWSFLGAGFREKIRPSEHPGCNGSMERGLSE